MISFLNSAIDYLYKKFSFFQLKTKSTSRVKIGIAVLISGRAEYLETSLNSLFKSNLGSYDVTFLLQNHGSNSKKIKAIINKKRAKKYKIIRSYEKNETGSWGEAFNKATKKLIKHDSFNIIGTCDSDAIYHEDWLLKSIKTFLWVKKTHNNHILGPFSSFNSSDYPFHKNLGEYKSPHGDYVIKERMGGLNYFYFTDDLKKIGFFDQDKDDETKMTKKFKKLRIRNFSTKISWVDHIGQISELDDFRKKKLGSMNYVYGLNIAKGNWNVPKNTFLERKIDLVIPYHKKDRSTINLCIDNAKKFLNIGKVYVITNRKSFSDVKHKAHLLDEDSFLEDLNIEDMKSIWKNKTMKKYLPVTPGWVFQQFIKLEISRKIDDISDYYLILDSDTIFLRKVNLFNRNKPLINQGVSIHKPYFLMINKLLEKSKNPKISFISHHLLVNKHLVKEMLKNIEVKTNIKPWYRAVLHHYDYKIHSGFSEYETYGYYIKSNYYNSYKLRKLKNKDINYVPKPKDILKLSKKYDYVSSHKYSREN